jgi:inosine triphosphate pyrophosphatase
MAIRFITGNSRKFEEVQAVVHADMRQVSIDLSEIQSLDAHEVIRAKLLAAAEHEGEGEYLVEDTSLFLECLNDKLPGPFIKWFEKAIEIDGLVRLVEALHNANARAVTLLGYMDARKEIHFFEGVVDGTIVPRQGDKDFGWGPIFQPKGSLKTFGEMDRDEKHAVSMRGIAAKKFAAYLEKA